MIDFGQPDKLRAGFWIILAKQSGFPLNAAT